MGARDTVLVYLTKYQIQIIQEALDQRKKAAIWLWPYRKQIEELQELLETYSASEEE